MRSPGERLPGYERRMRARRLTLACLAFVVLSGCKTTSPIVVPPGPHSDALESTDLRPGTGETAEPGLTVRVQYRGVLLDGTEFVSTYDEHPLTFTLGAHEMIPGLEQGIVGMREGGKRQLVVPPALGFGDRERPLVPPNSHLVFEVELLEAGYGDLDEARQGPDALSAEQQSMLDETLQRSAAKAARCAGTVPDAALGRGTVQVTVDGSRGRVVFARVPAPWAGTAVERCIKLAFVGELFLPFDGPPVVAPCEVQLGE